MSGEEKDWRDEVSMEELPKNLQRYAKIIGAKAAIRLAEAEGGLPLYIPKADEITALVRNRRIRAEFDGFNQTALARKYKLSVRWIYEIVNTSEPDARQLDLVKFIEERGA